MDDLTLNVSLLRRRVPNLTAAARDIGLRPATVSNLCTGKIPVGRAEVRTLAALATLAGCTMDELIVRGRATGMIETGIKVIDVFGPLARGATIGCVARPGMGQMVLLAELYRRLKDQGFSTLFWTPGDDKAGVADVLGEADYICHDAQSVYEGLVRLGGEAEVLFGADRSVVLSGELFEVQDRLSGKAVQPITTVLVDTAGEGVDEEIPYGPLDTSLRFDMDLAARGYFPAVDPVLSASVLLEGVQVDTKHMTIQQRARKLLRRYKELHALARVRGGEAIPDAEQMTYDRGERLEAYLTQPLFVAEEVTKVPGVWVSLNDALEGMRKILDGAADDMDVTALKYIGQLDNVR